MILADYAPANYHNRATELIHDPRFKKVITAVIDKIKEELIPHRCRVREAEKVMVVKIRSVTTCNELFFIKSKDPSKDVTLRFYRYADRYNTTTSVRQLMCQIDFDLNTGSVDEMIEVVLKEGLAWLYPSASNLKAPRTKQLVSSNIKGKPSKFLPLAYRIGSATASSSKEGLFVRIEDGRAAHQHLIPMERINKSLDITNLIGRYYVEFYNGEFLILTDPVFFQQFTFQTLPSKGEPS